jgi:hypothetical protein
MTKPPAKAAARTGTQAAAPEPTGCCDIVFDNGTGERFEHITEEACRQKGITLRGAAHWVAGDCA